MSRPFSSSDSHEDPFDTEGRIKLRQSLAEAGVLNAVERELNPVIEDVPDRERAWNELAERFAPNDQGRRLPPSKYGRYRWNTRPIGGRAIVPKMWSAIAGVAIGLIGIVIGWESGIYRSTGPSAAETSTYATANGQRANIRLLDGTQILLDVGSRLDVPANFAAGNRTVYLKGEALFTVSHHEGKPFTVVAGTTHARVLGTTFAVRHYSTDTNTTVSVRDGKVEVGHTILTAQRLVEIGPTGRLNVRPASPASFSFASGVLTLEYMPLASAIPALNRWYDADIRLGNSSLAARPIKGEFKAGSLGDLADVLTVGFDVRVVRSGRILTLYPRSVQ